MAIKNARILLVVDLIKGVALARRICSGKDYEQDAQDGRWREEVWGESELQNVTDMADISM